MAATTEIEFMHSIDLVRAEEQVSIGEFTKMLYDRYEISTKFLIPVLILNTNQLGVLVVSILGYMESIVYVIWLIYMLELCWELLCYIRTMHMLEIYTKDQ